MSLDFRFQKVSAHRLNFNIGSHKEHANLNNIGDLRYSRAAALGVYHKARPLAIKSDCQPFKTNLKS
jgi:hypothetical protein